MQGQRIDPRDKSAMWVAWDLKEKVLNAISGVRLVGCAIDGLVVVVENINNSPVGIPSQHTAHGRTLDVRVAGELGEVFDWCMTREEEAFRHRVTKECRRLYYGIPGVEVINCPMGQPTIYVTDIANPPVGLSQEIELEGKKVTIETSQYPGDARIAGVEEDGSQEPMYVSNSPAEWVTVAA